MATMTKTCAQFPLGKEMVVVTSLPRLNETSDNGFAECTFMAQSPKGYAMKCYARHGRAYMAHRQVKIGSHVFVETEVDVTPSVTIPGTLEYKYNGHFIFTDIRDEL